LEIYAVDRALLAALRERLARRMAFELVVTDRHLYVTIGETSLAGVVTPLPLT
jgi:hypothetical protein